MQEKAQRESKCNLCKERIKLGVGRDIQEKVNAAASRHNARQNCGDARGSHIELFWTPE